MKASDIDMQDLALIYDDEYGPDYVAGIMASEFPVLDTDVKYKRVLGMLKDAARLGQEDYPLNFLANRIAELGMKENKMRITKQQLQQVIREAIQEEMEDDIGFATGERVLEFLFNQFGVREERAPDFLRFVADRLEGK